MNTISSLAGKRILFIFNALHLGGAERQALLLARALQEQHQAQVEFWGLREAGRAAELCDEYGIPWRLVPFHWAYNKVERLGNLLRFARRLRAARPDIIMPYTMLPNVVCGLTWRLSGAKVCVWNQRDEGRDRFQPFIERWAARLTPRFISNSQHGADFLVEAAGVSPERISVIYNGVTLPAPEADRAAWRAGLDVTENCLLACMVANLTRYKDHATLLRAWRQVVDQMQESGQETILLLAGRPDDAADSLKALAYDLELGRHAVRFLGRVDDIAGLLGAVDLAVFSSYLEGVPNGILECMAAGLPVVATDIPGIREALGDQSESCLANPQNAEELACRISDLLSDASLRQKWGTHNKQRIEEQFTPERMAQETDRLLKSLLK